MCSSAAWPVQPSDTLFLSQSHVLVTPSPKIKIEWQIHDSYKGFILRVFGAFCGLGAGQEHFPQCDFGCSKDIWMVAWLPVAESHRLSVAGHLGPWMSCSLSASTVLGHRCSEDRGPCFLGEFVLTGEEEKSVASEGGCLEGDPRTAPQAAQLEVASLNRWPGVEG